MQPLRSLSKWKEAVVAVLALALLAFLLWLFLRPAQPARDIVFGDLGRRPGTNNNAAGGRTDALLAPEMPTNARPGSESVPVPSDQNTGPAEQPPLPAQTGQGNAMGDSNSILRAHEPSENSNPVSSSNQVTPPSAPLPSHPPPAAHASVPRAHTQPAFFEDNSQSPEPAHKSSTAALLAAAKEAGRGADRQSPARTADLLGNGPAASRIFDPEAGSNVVFIIDNSLSMMTNGKSTLARLAVAWTIESMSARQTFYVLLFHSGGYEGMPSLGPMSAIPENVRAMTNWLLNVGHRTGADPTKAVQRALGLARAPDMVWLLSDSEIPDKVADNVREANASVNAHINTIGFYTKDGEPGLRRVADENRGVYRFIPPPPNEPAP